MRNWLWVPNKGASKEIPVNQMLLIPLSSDNVYKVISFDSLLVWNIRVCVNKNKGGKMAVMLYKAKKQLIHSVLLHFWLSFC